MTQLTRDIHNPMHSSKALDDEKLTYENEREKGDPYEFSLLPCYRNNLI